MTLAPFQGAMRAFGHAGDLELDLGQPDRPGVVTALLARCSTSADPSFWWSQPVGRRTAALLQLVALTEQRDELSLSTRCSEARCGETFAFDLPLRTLPAATSVHDPLQLQLDGERELTMRRATGEDLRRWRSAQPESRGQAVRAMLDSLVITGHVGPEDEAVVSAAIAAMDPLVDFTVSCTCPACGAPNEVGIDLEALALSRLAARQRAMMLEVHRFASHYGWTEAEVLAVPPARRARYLALIEDRQ